VYFPTVLAGEVALDSHYPVLVGEVAYDSHYHTHRTLGSHTHGPVQCDRYHILWRSPGGGTVIGLALFQSEPTCGKRA